MFPDGLNVLKDAPKQIGSVLARDIIVAFVKEHQPLTVQVLGGLSGGGLPRIQQNGAAKRSQTGE